MLLLIATTAFAANDDSAEKKEKPLRFVPLITSTPLTGTGVGAAASYLYKMGEDSAKNTGRTHYCPSNIADRSRLQLTVDPKKRILLIIWWMDLQEIFGNIDLILDWRNFRPGGGARNVVMTWRNKMMNLRSLVVILGGVCMAATGMAQELMIFPNDNQTPEKQEEDKFACYGWAKGETGFDPMAPPTATEAPPQQSAKQGGLARGAVRGAAIGQIVGGDSSSTKSGAAAGAAIGGMRRNDQKRKEQQAQQQWEQDQARIYTENRNRYNRAYAACLEGKNYTVR